jgi:hypothetical protein
VLRSLGNGSGGTEQRSKRHGRTRALAIRATLPRRMGRAGDRWRVGVAMLGTAAALAATAAPAAADRAPSKTERAAIKRVALDACSRPDCEFGRARVSTPKARFAWADVVGEGFSGVLLKRPSRHSVKFRVIGTQGGGIGECSYWRARAPRSVLRDLHVSGLVGTSGEVRNCGKRG